LLEKLFGVGFAAFEGSDELLDWGRIAALHGGKPVRVPLDAKLALLLDRCSPDVVAIKAPRTSLSKRMVRTVVDLAHDRRIPTRLISTASVRKAFPENNSNKYQIASAIATRYPELSPRLGSRRKIWQAEKYSMSIFDAVALGVTYFLQEVMSDTKKDKTLLALPH